MYLGAFQRSEDISSQSEKQFKVEFKKNDVKTKSFFTGESKIGKDTLPASLQDKYIKSINRRYIIPEILLLEYKQIKNAKGRLTNISCKIEFIDIA